MGRLKKVTTFDGKEWLVEELQEKAKDDSFYYGYLAKNVLSSSSIKLLSKSPKRYRDMLEGDNLTSKALEEGKLIHTMLLEPEKVKDINIVDTTTRGTKVFKTALAENPNSFTKKEFDYCKDIANAVKGNSSIASFMEGCEAEKAIIGEISGIPFRAKADLISNEKGVLIDVKTTSDIERFKWNVLNFGYHMQVYIYCELFGISYDDFYFLVVDKKTKVVGVFSVTEETYFKGLTETENAIEEYKRYFIEKEDSIDNFTVIGEV